MSDAPKRMGRPRKYPVGTRRLTISCRVTAQLHAQLLALTADSGRSLSEEIEGLLEAGFRAADLRAIVREEMRAALDETKGA